MNGPSLAPERRLAHRGANAGWGLLAAGVPFLVFLRTMAPTVYGLDSAELSTGAYVLGIVHPPGSPTYMLLGHLFSRLPIGDVGYRLNLMSAVAAALAVFFFHRILIRLTGQRALALACAWFFAFTYYYWVSAVAAELYALHTAFVAGLLVLVLRWRDEARPTALCLLALFFGLGAGNHLAMVLLFPGFAWLAATGRAPPWRPAWLGAAAVACGMAGAAVYLYLPVRYLGDPPLNYARTYWHVDLASFDGIRWMLTARLFSSYLFGVPVADLPAEIAGYAERLWSNFVGLGVLLGVLGLASDFHRRPSLHTGLALLFGGHLVFYLGYSVSDKELMLLPTYLVWALWVAIGSQAFCRGLAPVLGPRWSIPAPALLFALAIACLIENFGRVDLSDDWSARRRGERILACVDPDAVYLGGWADVPILEYLQIVERFRPDVRTVNLFFTSGRGAEIAAEMLRDGRAVYVSRPQALDGSGLVVDPVADCGCYRVRPAPIGQEESRP